MSAHEQAGNEAAMTPHPPVIADALWRATDTTTDAWAVFEAIRADGELIDLRLLYGNPAYWNLTGFDPDEAVGKAISQLIPGADLRQGALGQLMAAIEAGGAFADRHVQVRRMTGPMRGQRRTFEVEGTAVGDILAVGFRDITADLEAQQRRIADANRNAGLAHFLAASVDPTVARGDLLRTLATELAATVGGLNIILELGPDASIRVAAVAGGPDDAAGRIEAIVGGQSMPLPDEMRGQFAADASVLYAPIPDEIRTRIVGQAHAVGIPDDLATSASSMIAVPITSGGVAIGRIDVIRFGDEPLFTTDDHAGVESIAAAAALVLERRAVEDELATSLARFEALFEQAPIPMVTISMDRTVRFNAAAVDLFGRERSVLEEMAFQPEAPWIPSDQHAAWDRMRHQIVSAVPRSNVRFALMRPNGERREVEGTSIPFVTRTGAMGGIVAVLTDLTDRLALEAQFRHAQKMEALGRLAGGIAHDFNNVLMAILGYAEFVAEDVRAGTATPADADQVVAATQRAIDLTARLTSFARREPIRREPIDVAECVRAVLPLVQRLTPESIELVTDVAGAPSVMLDRSEFEQVIVNLVVNAVDAMPQGGRLVIETGTVDLDEEHAATHLRGSTGPHALVAVTDTGIGMDAATKARIFEPFYTTKGVGEGTGLGLSMVFAAVERAGGNIWVYSEPGHGTAFKIYLPQTPQTTEPSDAAPPRTATGGPEAVLVVEDEPLVRDIVARMLRNLGYEVTVAGRPSEALEIVGGRAFDVLVSDVVMPEMTGDVLAARVRETLPGIPVVFMSGYTANALDFGLGPGDWLVTKPVASADLGRTIRAALDGSRDQEP